MTQNATPPLGAPQLIDDPDLFPSELPEGVSRTKKYYAYKRVAADGSQHWEWYERESGQKAGTGNADPILTTQVIAPRTPPKPANAAAETVSPATAAAMQAQRDKNFAETGFPDTDGERREREKKAPASASQSETQKNEAELNRERAWNADPANIPNGATGFRDTHAEAAERKAKAAAANTPSAAALVGTPTGNTDEIIRDGKKIKRTEYLLPNGTTEYREQATLPEQPGDPKTTLTTINGQPGYRTVTTPQGSGKPDKIEYFDPTGAPIPSLPADRAATDPTTVKGEPVYRNGKAYIPVTVKDPKTQTTETYHIDENGVRVTLPMETKPGSFNAKMEPFTPDPSKPFAGIVDYAKNVHERVKDGTLTTAEADAIIGPARELAEAFQADVRGRVSAAAQEYATSVSQRGQDVQQTGQRLSAGVSVFQNALSEANRILPTLAEHSANAPGLALGNMALGHMMAQRFGGLKDTPRVETPAIIGQYITPPGAAPASAQVAAPAAAVAPPNAIGAGAAPGVLSPGAPASVPAPAPYDVNLFDRGPDGTPVPREYTPSGNAPVGMQAPASASAPSAITDEYLDALGLPTAEQMELEKRRRVGFGIFA